MILWVFKLFLNLHRKMTLCQIDTVLTRIKCRNRVKVVFSIKLDGNKTQKLQLKMREVDVYLACDIENA